METSTIVLIIGLIGAAEVVGLLWWRSTARRRSGQRGTARRRSQQERLNKAFVDHLMALRQLEQLPQYPLQGDAADSEAVTFYTVVRGDAAKVAAVISEKSASYEETSRRHGDADATRAASTIRKMLNTRGDSCSFHWGTNSVEYRLHRDQRDEFMFVEIMKRPR